MAILHLFQKMFHHNIIRLLRRYKNKYDLHRFSIENSSIQAISHLFWRFHTFFSHLFSIFFSLCTSPQWYATFKKNVGQYLKPFSNFALCHDLRRHTHDGRRRLGWQYPKWTKSFRLKMLLSIEVELIYLEHLRYFHVRLL